MLLLFGLLFAATYWVQFNSTRTYLAATGNNGHQYSNLTGACAHPYLENGDKVGAESVIQAILMAAIIDWFALTCLHQRMSSSRENTNNIQGAAVVCEFGSVS